MTAVGCWSTTCQAIVWPTALPLPPDIPELALDHGDEPLASVECDSAGLRLRSPAGLVLHAEPDTSPRALARLPATARRLARWQRQSVVLTELGAVALLRCEWGLIGSDDPLPDHGAELHEAIACGRACGAPESVRRCSPRCFTCAPIFASHT